MHRCDGARLATLRNRGDRTKIKVTERADRLHLSDSRIKAGNDAPDYAIHAAALPPGRSASHAARECSRPATPRPSAAQPRMCTRRNRPVKFGKVGSSGRALTLAQPESPAITLPLRAPRPGAGSSPARLRAWLPWPCARRCPACAPPPNRKKRRKSPPLPGSAQALPGTPATRRPAVRATWPRR